MRNKKTKDGWEMNLLTKTDSDDKEDKSDEGHVTLSDIFKVPESVVSIDNHIYFYSEVDRSSILELNKKISELENSIKIMCIKYGMPLDSTPIYLHINSYGGSVHAAMAGVDKILSCPIPITTFIEGAAASAATLLSVVGDKRVISPHSTMLIHELSSMFWGKYHELIDDMQNAKMLMDMIYGIYNDYTKISKSKLTKMLEKDIWLPAKKCLEYGLVDEVGTIDGV